ncbi:MAG: TRAP transporter large permease [Deltaproteobacteria bacterium]|nr:TRAP transporter large permease [Deltaproteobacteria bacterium]
MPPHLIGVLGVVVFLILAILGLPIAFSFATAGFIGIVFIQGLNAGLASLGEAAYSKVASYVLSTIPLFVLMGQFAFHSGISRDLFLAAYKWMGRLPGGLALATTLSCTGFAACTGSSVASAATMGTIAYPEMERFKYSPRLATGSIAAGGTLGILIPPSTIFIIYGIITETSSGDLFIAGIFPGLLLSSLFCAMIYVMCKRNPEMGPPSQSFSWKERFSSLTGVWGMLVLFILVIAGLYAGIFAPSEAGAIGAFGALIIALVRGKLTRSSLLSALKETVRVSCFSLFVLVGAMLFNTFLSITGLPQMLSGWVTSLPFSPIGILILLCIFYVPLGMVIDCLPMILLTMPFVFPIIEGFGFSPVWFGVLVCVLGELSLITPPVGINIYVVQGVTKAPLQEVARGIIPFVIVFLIGIALLIAFPQISLFLPASMK